MKILLLTTSFPPYADSQTIRTLYLLQDLAGPEHEWTFIVPGAEPGRAVSLSGMESLMPANVKIIHTKQPAMFRFKHWVSKRIKNKFINWCCSNFIYYLSFPDQFMGWNKVAVKAATAVLKSEKIDLLFSASGSPTAHLAAKKLKKTYRLPWVADYGDPWYFVDRATRGWIAPFSYLREQQMVPHIDHAIFTTNATRDLYDSWLKEKMPARSTIVYGFHPGDVPDIGKAGASEELMFSHVGAAFVGDRNLIPLINALHQANKNPENTSKLTIGIVGNHSAKFDEECERLGLQGIIKGRVSYEESLRDLMASQVLVIVGNKGGMQVPGKVFPYLATERPILYIRQRWAGIDPAYELLKEFPGVVTAANDADALELAVKEIAENYDEMLHQSVLRVKSDALGCYSTAVIGRSFSSIVKNLISK